MRIIGSDIDAYRVNGSWENLRHSGLIDDEAQTDQKQSKDFGNDTADRIVNAMESELYFNLPVESSSSQAGRSPYKSNKAHLFQMVGP